MVVVSARRAASARHDRGYSLLETLVALALFGIALVVAAHALSAHAVAARRLELRQELVRTAETVLESVRAGVVPLATGPVDLGEEFAPADGAPVASSLRVDALEPAGLFKVRVRASGRTAHGGLSVTLTTMVWQP